MVAQLNPKITAFEAQAAANGFLLDHLPDRYGAYDPRLESSGQVWRVSVHLTYPFIGSIGEVGEIRVSAFSEEIISFTPVAEMRERARKLYDQHQAAIEAARWPTPAGAIPQTSAFEAEATAGGFLLNHLPDRFSTGAPRFDEASGEWRVPVILAYPRIGSVGEVGELAINDASGEVVSHTPFDEIKKRALDVYEQRRDEIKAAFSLSRD